MSLLSELKQDVLEKMRHHENDTGSSETQVIMLTARIKYLTSHFKTHKKDFHSKYGLLKMVNKRKGLLKYLVQQNMKVNDLVNQ